MKKLALAFILFIMLLFAGCSDDNDTSVGITPSLLKTAICQFGDWSKCATITDEGSIVFITDPHFKNHNGEFYTASFTETLNTGQSSEFMMCLDNVTMFHFIDLSLAISGSPVNFLLYENPTLLTNGTQFNMTNMNRDFKNITPSFVTYNTPTYSAPGLLLFQDAITGTSGQGSKINAPFRLASEWILVDGCFLFIITNNDGNNNDIYVNFYGYQE